MDIRLLDEQDRKEIEGKLGNLSSLSTDNKTSLVSAINEVNDKTIIQKYEEPTINDKNYRIGQLWYSEKTRNIYVLNEVDDGGAYWDIFLKGGQIKPQWIYGFEVDEDNLNPATAVTYIGRNKNFTPARVVDGKIDWGSWEQFVKDISYRVVVRNGIEQYKVQYDDPTKKLDGSPSVLTGEDGDLFTKFKLIYRKYTKTAKGYKIELSDEPFEGARSLVAELEDGYNQFNNPVMILLQDLYLLLFKDRDSQSALGRGYVDGTTSSDFKTTGGTNGKGFVYGATTGRLQMCFLGIEDLWGNKYQYIDGLVSDGSYNLKVGTKGFNNKGNGYTTIKTSNSSSLRGYFKSTVGGEGGYVLADNGTASSSTGYCDIGVLDSSSFAQFGGNRSLGSPAGIFYVRVTSTVSFSTDGSRLCFKDDTGVYVGNYLGYVDGTKLRSISGKIPTGRETIEQLREYAQNNN